MKLKNIFNTQLYKIKISELRNQKRAKSRDKALNKLPLINYFIFENEFRGPEDVISERQKKYVKYFKACKNVLDIGCGRGEFIELLKRKKIRATGIDSDTNMVKVCQKRKLNVYSTDLFDYLLSCMDNYHDGIIALQVVEHLNSRRVQNFVKLCFDKVEKNRYVIFETVNPLCPQALGYFWADLTHEKPLVPQVLRYICSYYGFSKVDIVGRTPVLPNIHDFVINPKDLALYGDYAIIAYK